MSVSCWEEGPRRGESATTMGVGSTCFLPDGHDGPHDFEWDDEVIISLADPGVERG